ncbi:cold-shock protein [Paracoccus sp. p4-l81]|uniref:cold-shock protein n=1 Tax=unclassified Paracoccus (in: a-proteobacteria) TaxID=2688777 RepID=UPI0035BAEDCA
MDNSVEMPRKIVGRVKWFDPAKGFGFIVDDSGERDILLHANVLRNFGQSSVADMSQVTVMVSDTARGRQAVEVLSIAPPEVNTPAPIEDLCHCDLSEITARPLEPARVKWFDKVKGFGFANVFGRCDDIFLHIEVLRHSGFADLQPGEAVALRIVDGRRGLMAAQVLPWESAARPAEVAEDA